MKTKGFFVFAIVLAMILILFWLNHAGSALGEELTKTKNELIKAEQGNLKRTILENNTDKIILSKLYANANKRNFNVLSIQNEINSELEKHLKSKTFSASRFKEKKGETTKQMLNENTSAMIIQLDGSIYAEYSFTSTPSKDTRLIQKIGEGIITWFELPIGYTQKILVLIN